MFAVALRLDHKRLMCHLLNYHEAQFGKPVKMTGFPIRVQTPIIFRYKRDATALMQQWLYYNSTVKPRDLQIIEVYYEAPND